MRGTILFRTLIASCVAVGLSSAAANAEGDPEKGEKTFKKCVACHSLEEGKKKVGPSLYQIIGKKPGAEENYKYSDSYVQAAEKGLIWTPENLIAYLEDPKGFMREYLDDKKARSKMVLKFKKLSDRENVVAYLQSLQKPAE